MEPVNGGPIAQQEGGEPPSPEQPSGEDPSENSSEGSPRHAAAADSAEAAPNDDTVSHESEVDSDGAHHGDSGHEEVEDDGGDSDPDHDDYRSMSARELRYLARGRGLMGSYWEGRGSRRAALIAFLEYGSLDNLPGCHVRNER